MSLGGIVSPQDLTMQDGRKDEEVFHTLKIESAKIEEEMWCSLTADVAIAYL